MSDKPPARREVEAPPLPEHYVTVGKAKDGDEPGTAFPHVLTFVARYGGDDEDARLDESATEEAKAHPDWPTERLSARGMFRQPGEPRGDWLDEIVTDEAKRDPDWRRKAMTGRGMIEASASRQPEPRVPPPPCATP